jgi:hypothetical protein
VTPTARPAKIYDNANLDLHAPGFQRLGALMRKRRAQNPGSDKPGARLLLTGQAAKSAQLEKILKKSDLVLAVNSR